MVWNFSFLEEIGTTYCEFLCVVSIGSRLNNSSLGISPAHFLSPITAIVAKLQII